MTSTSPTAPVIHNRSRFRRPVWILLGLGAALFLSWLGYGYWQDWADAKSWGEYLTELNRREPNWRERVFGRPATSEEEVVREQLMQLHSAISTNNQAWGPYRSSIYGGFLQDPDQPAARLTPDQHEFLKWLQQAMKPYLEQAHLIDGWSSLNHHYQTDLPYDRMIRQASPDSTYTYLLNEIAELQALFWMQENKPDEAASWISRCIKLQKLRSVGPFQEYSTLPLLVERWLNLTEPSPSTLKKLQSEFEVLVWSKHQRFKQLGGFCRLQGALIKTIHRGELTAAENDRYRYHLIPNDSLWQQPWCRTFRQYYLKYKISRLFRRADHVHLRLHELADRIEALVELPVGNGWRTWQSFASENNLHARIEFPHAFRPTKAIPGGVNCLLPGIAFTVAIHFDQEAQFAAVLASLAAERFRRDHGRMPERVEELVPRYLSQEPLDPFTGKPLLLRQTSRGIVMYSVGREGKDEGGEKLSFFNYWHFGGQSMVRMRNATNVGARLYLPAFRRGAPIELEEEQIKAINSWRTFKPQEQK